MGKLEFVLVTHATELNKPTNTGQLVLSMSKQVDDFHCQRLLWSRVTPDTALLASLQQGHCYLLYPTIDALTLPVPPLTFANDIAADISLLRHELAEHDLTIILLDATWQLAKKMWKQSPYLQQLPSLQLQSEQPSRYRLRRNQVAQGWCTAESVAMLLSALGKSQSASQLLQRFVEFNTP